MIVSTLLLALALAAAHLPRLAARTRYAIVFIALLKFAVPATIVPHAVAESVGKPVMLITALRPLTPPPATPSRMPLVIAAWALIAFALALRLALRWRRSVAGALAASTPFDDAALAAAATRVGLHRRVALRRSPSVLAPVTIGVVRPVIVIPEDLAFSTAELESILAHECAHVARHDNALAIIEALFGCALWFHPLVWIARTVLARAREQACDERVTASGDRRVYLDALTRVAAHGVALPAGISCAVGNGIKERIEAIMQEKPRPLSHRLVIIAAVAVVAVITMGSAPAADDQLYDLAFSVERNGGQFMFDVTITDHKTGAVVLQPRVTAPAETPAEAISGDLSQEMRVSMIAHRNGQAEVTLRVTRNGRVVETMERRSTSSDKSNRISMQLKDADVRDVVNTFGKLANLKIKIDDDVSGTVSVNLHDVPWTEALDQILRDARLRYELRGSNLHVFR